MKTLDMPPEAVAMVCAMLFSCGPKVDEARFKTVKLTIAY